VAHGIAIAMYRERKTIHREDAKVARKACSSCFRSSKKLSGELVKIFHDTMNRE
jgi:hypothetical protein